MLVVAAFESQQQTSRQRIPPSPLFRQLNRSLSGGQLAGEHFKTLALK
jgi:hypothetical protein